MNLTYRVADAILRIIISLLILSGAAFVITEIASLGVSVVDFG